MAGGSRAIVIRFLGNTQGLNSQLTAAQRRMQAFRRSVAVGAAAMGASLVVVGKQAIQVASDTAEAQSKSQNVFGAWTASVDAFAASSATSFGISKRAALDYTSAMGSVLVAQGFSQQSAAGLSLQYTKLAADLASFNNTSINDAAAALQASLTGEFEQLKKYGIVINDVRLKQEAQKEGMKAAGVTFSAAQKNQLAYAIVLHDTAQAQGDFARTSNGLANQQRILAAQVDDLQGRIGAKLLPAALKAVAAFNSFATWVEHNQTTAKTLAGIIAGLAAVVFAVAAAQRVAAAASAIWTAAMWLLNAAFLGNPIGAVVLLVAALAAGFVLAWQKSETFRKIVIGAFNLIVAAVGAAVKAIVAYFHFWIDLALLGFQKLLEGLGHLPSFLGGGKADKAAAALANLRANFSATVDHINGEIDRIVDTVQVNVNVKFTTEQQKVGVNQSDLNAAQNEKGARARNAAKDAAAAAANAVAAAPVISFPKTAVAPVATKAPTAKKAAVVKEAKKTGAEILDGFLGGLSSRFPAVSASLQAWSDKLPVHLGHGLDGIVAAAEKGLTRLQKAIDANASRLDKANQALADAKSRLADYSKGVRDSITALGDLGTHGGATFEIVRDRLSQSLANARDFAATMAALSRAGLNAAGLQQLIAAGPGVATATGKAILEGGRAGIAQINATQKQLDDLAKRTGATLGNQFYAQGVAQAQGIVEGLKSRQKALEAQMKAAGKALADSVLAHLQLKATATGVKVAARAAGGPVVAGRPYLVGEAGPELFVPRRSGAIVAHGAGTGGDTIVIENHIEIGGEVVRVTRSEISAANRRTRSAVTAGARRAVA